MFGNLPSSVQELLEAMLTPAPTIDVTCIASTFIHIRDAEYSQLEAHTIHRDFKIPDWRRRLSLRLKTKYNFPESIAKSVEENVDSTPTEFHKFLDLPNELQLKIIRFCLAEKRIVAITRPLGERRRGLSLLYGGLRPNCTFPVLEVCHKFRQEGLKTHPLCFPVIDGAHSAPPMTRFNFEQDTLIMPQFYLGQRHNFTYHHLNRVQSLMISWDYRSNSQAFVNRIVDLLLHNPHIKNIPLIHQAHISKDHGRNESATTHHWWDIRKWSLLSMDVKMELRSRGFSARLSDDDLVYPVCRRYKLPELPDCGEEHYLQGLDTRRRLKKDKIRVLSYEMERHLKKVAFWITERDWR